MPLFSFTPAADPSFTSLATTVVVSPRVLVEKFGQPGNGDGFKTSGEYFFTSAGGEVVTLYDWKATSLFFEGEGDPSLSHLPRPELFWSLSAPQTFNVGTKRNSPDIAKQFCEWLLVEVSASA